MHYRLLIVEILLNKILEYVEGYLEVNALHDWVLGQMAIILSTRDEAAIQLANGVLAWIGHYEEGVIYEPELRRNLRDISSKYEDSETTITGPNIPEPPIVKLGVSSSSPTGPESLTLSP
jgi:hypothetical protein